ncbi:hypothetical protein [Bacillus sp. MRMR6]|uniref:hypothetical protein n=1 Tax=Bacillus sp. MRMR6 TaxID=1928617 RepID=UPI000952314A|nr:hypothetical protein [Bacillus sp. MRMR6]OLS35456.1 hypothetical protein BTR25_19885 [Bacillus sp. MRMR6]
MRNTREHGQSSSIKFNEIIQHLRANNIDVHIEYEHTKRNDQGASGGFYEVILFIQNTIVSGFVYDLIKKLPAIKSFNFTKERIDIIKEKASKILNTQPENLDLTDLEEVDGTVNVVFRFNRVDYNFKFNDKNIMIHFKKIR